MAITYTLDSLKAVLLSLGHTDIKKMSANRLTIYTKENRIAILEQLSKKISGARYDKTPKSDSTVGRLHVGSFVVLVKPANRQGRFSAGVDNEDFLVKAINDLTATGPMTVEFKAGTKTFVIECAVSARHVGKDVSGGKKADVIVTDIGGVEYPISLKMDNAEMWGSGDVVFRDQGKQLIEKAVSLGIAKITDEGTYMSMTPNIATPATQEEKRKVVFGSDIERRGAVIQKTFTQDSFKQVDDRIIVQCTHIITELREVRGDYDVVFVIINTKTRRAFKDYPGLRPMAVFQKRVRPTVKIIPR